MSAVTAVLFTSRLLAVSPQSESSARRTRRETAPSAKAMKWSGKRGRLLALLQAPMPGVRQHLLHRDRGSRRPRRGEKEARREMIDYERLRTTPLVSEPFDHLVVPGFIEPGSLEPVLSGFPAIGKGGASPRASSRSARASRVFSKSFAGPSSGRRWREVRNRPRGKTDDGHRAGSR